MKPLILIYLLGAMACLGACDGAKDIKTDLEINHTEEAVPEIDSIAYYEAQREGRLLAYKKHRDSVNQVAKWKELKCGLWINRFGDIGFKANEAFRGEYMLDRYFTIFGLEVEKEIPLKSIIDTTSFRYLGSAFYKDKNNIYHHYTMADGGYFHVYDIADHATFRVVGGVYAKDKNHIFDERHGILEHVDYKTFRTAKGFAFAKDKHGYYFWDELITEESMKDTVVMNTLNRLDLELKGK